MAGGQERKKPTPIATQIVVADFGRSGHVADGGIELLYSFISGQSIGGGTSEFYLSSYNSSFSYGVVEGKSQSTATGGDWLGSGRSFTACGKYVKHGKVGKRPRKANATGQGGGESK